MAEVAQELRATPASVAIAWLRSQRGVAAPIASASRPDQVPALLDSARLQLSPQQVDLLSRASEPFVAAGG